VEFVRFNYYICFSSKIAENQLQGIDIDAQQAYRCLEAAGKAQEWGRVYNDKFGHLLDTRSEYVFKTLDDPYREYETKVKYQTWLLSRYIEEVGLDYADLIIEQAAVCEELRKYIFPMQSAETKKAAVEAA